jgi:calpain-15
MSFRNAEKRKSRRAPVNTNNEIQNTNNQSKPSIENLTENVFLYTTRYEDDNYNVSFKYETECARMNNLSLTLDFSRSSNMKIMNGNGTMVSHVELKPFTRVFICEVKNINTSESWSLSTNISSTLNPPDEEYLEQLSQVENAKLDILIQKAKKLNFSCDQVISHIDDVVRANHISYIDPDFPPTLSSLYSSTDLQHTLPSERHITWKRPNEFMNGEYHVFEDLIEPEDIRQGKLGDCWFLCALSALAEYEVLIKNLFLPESMHTSSSGLYRLRICKNCQWRVVTVDDYFPCIPGAGPVYARSHGNELWAMLVEKAFAKVHNSVIYIPYCYGMSK